MEFSASEEIIGMRLLKKIYSSHGECLWHKAIEKTLNELYDTKLNLVILGDDLISLNLGRDLKCFQAEEFPIN